ncbi:MAG: GAF domain-containing protein [Ardenticatenaceae bacterium]
MVIMVTSIFLLGLDQDMVKECKETLDTLYLSCQEVATLEELIQTAPPHSLVFLSIKKHGLEGLSDVRGQRPSLHVVVLGASGTTAEAIEAMRRGALDYLRTPAPKTGILQSARRWQEEVAMMSDAANLSEIIMLMELGRTLTGTLRLDELYEQIIEQVERAFRPDTVSLMLLTRSGRLRLVAERGLSSNAIPGTEVSLEKSIAGKVMKDGRPQLLLGGLEGTPFSQMARPGNKIASAMSIPLQVQRKTLGVLNVNRHHGRPNYTEKDANLLHIFAAQIAISIQNARLYESLREERDRIIEAQEEVRRELARDLHDGLTQVLATLVLNIDFLRSMLTPGEMVSEKIHDDLKFLRTVARQAIQDARTLTFGLRPLVLETQGLVAALKQYLDTMGEGDRATTYHLDYNGCPTTPWLDQKVARMVFAVLQEAISNARKHAEADNIWVSLLCPEKDGDYILKASVRDDGDGFDLSHVEGSYDERMSFGLHNMKERAALIDGTLTMNSDSNGTVIELSMPWREGVVKRNGNLAK